MAILLTGGRGFIGSHIVDYLSSEDDLIIYDRSKVENSTVEFSAKHINAELSDRDQLEQVFSIHNISHVIHLISDTMFWNSDQDTEFDIHKNIIDTIALLELCVRYKVTKIVYASSGGAIYGNARYLPIDEKHPTDPITSYGVCKLAIEKYLYMYWKQYGLNYAAIRIANPYGPRQSPISNQGVIAVFGYRILNNMELTIWGDGNFTRDYLHVQDVANLFVVALKSSDCGVFNAGSGVGRSVNEIIVALENILDKKAVISYENSRRCDVPDIVLDSSLALNTFGWSPQINFKEGLRDVVEWLMND